MFLARARSGLLQLTGTLNQAKYKIILVKYVFSFMKTCHSAEGDFIYQHNGYNADRTNIAFAYLAT